MSAIQKHSLPLLSRNILSLDQNTSISKLSDVSTFLYAPTGAGKTVCSLTAAADHLAAGLIKRVLVIAPLKVCQTAWKDEPGKWEHLKHLSVAVCTGKPAERLAALAQDADITIVNNENVAWLMKQYAKGLLHFDGLILDESSKWRETGGTAFKAIRKHLKTFEWRCVMTATPVAEDWLGLFGQMMLVDGGERLGRNKDKFKRTYFQSTDYMEYNWELNDGADVKLAALIEDVVHVMPSYKHELPPLTIVPVPIMLGKDVMQGYAKMCKDSVIKAVEFDYADKRIVEAPNAAVLRGKLHQMANGFLYDEEKEIIEIHDDKLVWTERRVKEINAQQENVVVVYWYKADLIWLDDAFPDALHIGSGMKKGALAETINEWQTTRGRVMFLHPASAGHGVDGLQYGGHRMIFLAPDYSRDRWEQVPGRLHRRGQTKPVEVEVLVAENTVDEIALASVEGKGEYQELFLQHLGAG